MKIESVQFVRSAAGAADLPRDGAPELAMVGRSNVGKSTLINALVRQPVARTSATPGKTRLLNLYRVVTKPTGPFYLVDLPGYGYSKKKDARGEFDRLAAVYFARALDSRSPTSGPSDLRGVSIGVLLAVDARHPGIESDLATAAWLRARGLEPLVVVTKLDKLSKSEQVASLREFARLFGTPNPAGPQEGGHSVFGNAVVGVAAETGEGIEDLWKRMASWTVSAAQASSPLRSRP